MIKYCRTCRLGGDNATKCGLTGVPIDPTVDYCSKHMSELPVCDVCGNPFVGLAHIELDENDNPYQLCPHCHQNLGGCLLCSFAQVCAFETNPDPMPKYVVKTIQQGNVTMQAQVKNEERVKKFCHGCRCWYEEAGHCLKDFNVGCVNLTSIFTSRES